MSVDSSIDCRAFFVIDALSPGALVWARKALVHLGGLLAMSLRRPPPLGVAVLQRNKATTQLQILLRPGRCFQLCEFMAGVARLTAADEPADGKTVGITIKALVEHMLTLGEGCTNHVFLLSSSFAPHATLQRVLQLVCSARVGACLHFLQLSDPGADQAQNDPPHPQQQQQQRDDFLPCLTGLQHRATFEEFTADCEAVTDLLCHSWCRSLYSPQMKTNPFVPDVLLQLGPGQAPLPCKLQQHLLQLDPWLLPAQLCPCHMLPMQPPTGSAAAALAAQSAASDAATAAALLALPEDPSCCWRCSITAQPVQQGCCATDACVLQLGRHTQLRVAAQGGSALPATLAGLAGSSAELPCGLALPLSQPCELLVQHAVSLSQVDSSMLYGMPLVLVPAGAACKPAAASDAAGAAAAAPCDSSIQEAGMLMRALCQLLLERGQVLLLAGCCDVVRRCRQPLKQWYVAQPAGDGASLLLRSIACREQLLPPVDLLQQLEAAELVLLLDAEQLDAVRSCLDSLPALGSSFRSSLPGAAAAAAGPGASGDTAEKESSQAEPAGEGGQAGGGGEQGEDVAVDVPLPLLLSCGLHDWVAQVLARSTGSYVPPASAPLAVPAPHQPPQQPAAAAANDADASCHQPQQLPQPTGSGPAGGSSSVAAGMAAAAFAGKAAAGGAAAAKRQQSRAAGDGSAGGSRGRAGTASKAGAGGAAQQQAVAAAGPAGTGGGKAGGRNALRLSSRRSGT